jgi:transcriptional regulator with XRE-family HTH domain
MKTGKAIRIMRKKTGERQTMFAFNIGISQTYLSQLENDLKEPSVEVLNKIAEYVGVPLPVLFWFGVTESDVPEHKIDNYRLLKPCIDSLINSLF